MTKAQIIKMLLQTKEGRLWDTVKCPLESRDMDIFESLANEDVRNCVIFFAIHGSPHKIFGSILRSPCVGVGSTYHMRTNYSCWYFDSDFMRMSKMDYMTFSRPVT